MHVRIKLFIFHSENHDMTPSNIQDIIMMINQVTADHLVTRMTPQFFRVGPIFQWSRGFICSLAMNPVSSCILPSPGCPMPDKSHLIYKMKKTFTSEKMIHAHRKVVNKQQLDISVSILQITLQ